MEPIANGNLHSQWYNLFSIEQKLIDRGWRGATVYNIIRDSGCREVTPCPFCEDVHDVILSGWYVDVAGCRLFRISTCSKESFSWFEKENCG